MSYLSAGLEFRRTLCDARRLWSLRDMLDKYGWWFFVLAEFLTKLHRELGLQPPQAFAPPAPLSGIGSLGGLGGGLLSLSGTTAPGNELALPVLPAPSSNNLSQEECDRIVKTLGWVESACRQLGMSGIIKDIERAKKDTGGLFPDRNKLRFHIEHITNRIVDELDEESFLHISAEKTKWYKKPDLFGSEIGAKFANAREDLTNAGSAFAVGLNTSCVFHLMRVLEHCVQQFGIRLKIKMIVKDESWANIMDHAHKAIEKMPGGPKGATKATSAQRAKRQQMALAADRLDHVRIAWRNDVMHPKATYDEREALEVLTSVRAFLETLVKLV